MSKKYKQMTLDDFYIITESDKKQLASLLNQYPSKNIAMVERGIGVDANYRPQIRFYSRDRRTVEWVKRVLKLSPRVKPLEREKIRVGWQIQVTSFSKVKKLLEMIFVHLSKESQRQAMMILDKIT